MNYHVITSANSINYTVANSMTSARDLGADDNLLVAEDGFVLATGADTTGVYVNGYADGAHVTVNGLVMGTRDGIYSLGKQAMITVHGKVLGGDTGISIYNGGTVFISETGVVSGSSGMSISGGSTLVNDGEVVGTDDNAIQLSEGTIVNSGLISGEWPGIFFGGEHSSAITNSGAIFGDLSTWYGAADPNVNLTINNSGDWHGSLLLAPGADTVKNTGTIDGNVSLGDGSDLLDSRYGLITGDIRAGAGNDTIRAGSEDNMIEGGAGADTIHGGGGGNTVSYQSSLLGVSVNLLAGTAKYGDATGDQLSNIQNVMGTMQNDVLVGDDAANVINGVLGKDRLSGNGGADAFTMYGGGNAIINGGAGNDRFSMATVDASVYGSAFTASNRINGGTGFDTLDLVNAGPVAMKNNTLVNVERIVVGDGYDYSLTTAGATVAKNKSLEIEAGSLTSSHTITFDGSAETNGRFVFNGGDGDDSFRGGKARDAITGNSGADMLSGGGGSDTFVFNTVTDSLFSDHDRITDFKAGFDKFDFDVDVTGVDAKVTGSVSSEADLTTLLGGHFDADHAVLVKVNGGSLSGHTLLVVDADSADGYLAAMDYVVDVTGLSGKIQIGDFLF